MLDLLMHVVLKILEERYKQSSAHHSLRSSLITIFIMTNQNSNLRSLLSPSRSGTFFAPFRSRSANPDGFDSKMKLWISAIEEWTVINKKLTLSLRDIHQIFISDAGIRPDKECIRLVFSEMKRTSKLVPLNTLKNSKLWSATANSHATIDNYIDPKSWIGWGVKKLVFDPATWAISSLTASVESNYSDLTDMSITDSMRFVCQKSLHEISQSLLVELLRISKAEKQVCFEWQHLLELITPIVNTIIDATDGKELLEMFDILFEYLVITRRVAIQIDNDTKLIKVVSSDDTRDDDVIITKKDIATARLLRAKELLTADADKYHNQAQKAKQDALDCYNRKEIAKAKSLLRSHKRLTNNAEQKEIQLNNVEIMLEQLENTDSNMMILQAYKDGAEALKIANTNLDNNTTILDDVYDATAEARQLNDDMLQTLKDISCISMGGHNISNAELEVELNDYIAASNGSSKNLPNSTATSAICSHELGAETSLDDLEKKLNELIVCQDPIDSDLNHTQSSETDTQKIAISETMT